MKSDPRSSDTALRLFPGPARIRCGVSGLLFTLAGFVGAAGAAHGKDSGFLPYVELAPFVVNGEQLEVSIHARTKSDRRYAAQFAREVIGVAYETMESTTGHGLVIVGRKGEPHPVIVYRQFTAMADAGLLKPEVAALSSGLTHMLRDWEDGVDMEKGSDGGPDIDFEMVVNAIPLPLEGIGSKLYQMAWAEEFDPERVELRLGSLTSEDLETDELARFDWVFYLPPRSAFSDAMKQVVPAMIKESDLGFMQRMALRSALTIFKPMLKTAIEGIRKGMLYLTVLRAMSDYSKDDIEALTEVYVESSMPFGGDSDYDTPIEAIRDQKARNAEYAANPFVSPTPLAQVDVMRYARFEGGYSDDGKSITHRFAIRDQACTWQYLDRDPSVFLPAGDRLLVSEDGRMTIEFLIDESGEVTAAEERWVRRNKTVSRKS